MPWTHILMFVFCYSFMVSIVSTVFMCGSDISARQTCLLDQNWSGSLGLSWGNKFELIFEQYRMGNEHSLSLTVRSWPICVGPEDCWLDHVAHLRVRREWSNRKQRRPYSIHSYNWRRGESMLWILCNLMENVKSILGFFKCKNCCASDKQLDYSDLTIKLVNN